MNTEKLLSLFRWVHGFSVPLYAANASFFLVLSAFPALLLLLGFLSRAGLDTGELLALLRAFLPTALVPAVEELIRGAYRHVSGTVLGISAVTGLWSASRGVYGLLQGMNRVYGITARRGYLQGRLLSMGCTLVFLLVILLTLGLQVFSLWSLPGILRYAILLMVQTGVFAAMYRLLPNRPGRFRAGLPGALLACVGWTVTTGLFSLYVRFSAGYASAYGSVYALALGMLWLYICINILFYGGIFNAFLEKNMSKP